MQNPLVSIIINCYNGEKYLKKCLQSAIGQTYSNIEIIFWDNLSIDKSIEIAERFRDKKIKIFESSKTTSLGEARNNAIKVSSGDLITFLDVDDWYSPEKIELQVQEFKNDQDIGLVFTNYYYYNDLDKTKKLSISEIGKDNIQQKLLDDYNIGILTVMIDKKLLLANNFNKDYNMIEDFDLIFRLSFITNFKYINSSLAFYRTHENNLSKLKLTNYIKELNDWKTFYKNKLNLRLNFKKFELKIKFMEIKRDIIYNKKLVALNKIISIPIQTEKIRKLKYVLLILMPNFIIKKLIQYSF